MDAFKHRPVTPGRIFIPRLPVGHPYRDILDVPQPPVDEEVATIHLSEDDMEELQWAAKRLQAIDTTGG